MRAKKQTAPQIIVEVSPLLLPVENAAAVLGVSVRTFERLSAAGRVPRPVHLGRRRLWRFQDLRIFVEARCRVEGMYDLSSKE